MLSSTLITRINALETSVKKLNKQQLTKEVRTEYSGSYMVERVAAERVLRPLVAAGEGDEG